MFSVRTERADEPWAVVHQPVPNHLVLALEAFSAFASGTAGDRAIVRSILAVNILMGTGGRSVLVTVSALLPSCLALIKS